MIVFYFWAILYVSHQQQTLHKVIFYKNVNAGSGSGLRKQLDPDSHWEKTAGSGSAKTDADPQPCSRYWLPSSDTMVNLRNILLLKWRGLESNPNQPADRTNDSMVLAVTHSYLFWCEVERWPRVGRGAAEQENLGAHPTQRLSSPGNINFKNRSIKSINQSHNLQSVCR